eukprot:GILJ01008294.1.p1 GENE.GILJ01008294.1~~GILJ01008294.1.p1  ORF type:complete len:259 (-),score=22.73 GILJ01008294.1:57-833(-)
MAIPSSFLSSWADSIRRVCPGDSTTRDTNDIVQFCSRHPLPTITKCFSRLLRYTFEVTFPIQEQIVEAEFPEDSLPVVNDLMKVFDLFIDDAKTLQPSRSLKEAFGEDEYECLLWRSGSLAFMLVSVLFSTNRYPSTDVTKLRGIIDLGISRLKQMLSVRPASSEHVGTAAHTNDISVLIAHNLFSDVHVLALAYQAELNYFGWKLCASTADLAEHAPCYRDSAIDLLLQYDSVVEKVLGPAGWTSDRAKLLLSELGR